MAERSARESRNRAVLGSSAPILPTPITTTWICFSVAPGPKSSAMLVIAIAFFQLGLLVLLCFLYYSFPIIWVGCL